MFWKKHKSQCAIFSAILFLTGCATSTQYGSFVQPDADQAQLAADAAQQIAQIHAPAHTRLVLRQPTPDVFGQTLVKTLRDKGYALVEGSSGAEEGLDLRYVLDALDGGSYRLMIYTGTCPLARAYTVSGGSFVPAGPWTFRPECSSAARQ